MNDGLQFLAGFAGPRKGRPGSPGPPRQHPASWQAPQPRPRYRVADQ
jgi:hypothetical protein